MAKIMQFFANIFTLYQFITWICSTIIGTSGFVAAIKQVEKTMPTASVIGYSIAAFFFLLLILAIIIPPLARLLGRLGLTKKPKDITQVPFYQELISKDMLKKELKTIIKEEAWVAWQTGYHLTELITDKDNTQKDIKDIKKIKRIILIHPDCVNIPPAISNTANFAQDIRDTTREAINKGIDVKWAMTLPTNVVIRDPNSKKASIRIEAYMVNIPTQQWPNFIITKKYQQGLFFKIITAYTKLWEDKEQRYIPQPEDYQER